MPKENSLTKKDYWEDIYAGKKRPVLTKKTGCIDRILKKNLIYYQLDNIFAKKLPSKHGLKFIEYGCGDSFWLPYFNVKFGCEVKGVDYSKLGCDLAEEQLQNFSANGCVVHKNFTELNGEFADDYDICASFGVIEHFKNPRGIVAKFFKTIKKNGIMITVIPNLTGIQGAMQSFISKDIYQLHKIMTLAQLMSFHRDLGMEIIYSGKLGLLTLGLNFSEKTIILGKLYRLYNYIVNRLTIILEKLTNPICAHLCGSSYIVIARKMTH